MGWQQHLRVYIGRTSNASSRRRMGARRAGLGGHRDPYKSDTKIGLDPFVSVHFRCATCMFKRGVLGYFRGWVRLMCATQSDIMLIPIKRIVNKIWCASVSFNTFMRLEIFTMRSWGFHLLFGRSNFCQSNSFLTSIRCANRKRLVQLFWLINPYTALELDTFIFHFVRFVIKCFTQSCSFILGKRKAVLWSNPRKANKARDIYCLVHVFIL